MDVEPKAAEPALERRFLGVVEVDSGTLLIGDPCYCLPCADQGKPGIDYESVLRATDDPAGYLGPGRLVLLLARFGGDGTFPVFGVFDEDGELIRASVEFVGPEDDEDEAGMTALRRRNVSVREGRADTPP